MIYPRILLEDFPQNDLQARYFMKNCTKPSEVFYVTCPKDTCQERILDLGRDHPDYVPSAILSKKVKYFYERLPKLIEILKAETSFNEISTEESFENSFKKLCKIIEPTIIHVRTGKGSDDLSKEIVDKLCAEQGFVNLEVNQLIKDEYDRKTPIGKEFLSMVAAGKIISADMMVRMLRKIIYSGQENVKKFILSGFPDIIEQATEFENSCANITAIIYASVKDPTIEIQGPALTTFNIDALFQKQFRLKMMNKWDNRQFCEMLGSKVDYAVVHGRALSGKTTVASYMSSQLGFKLVSMAAMEEQLKKKLGTEEEPVENVPMDKLHDAVVEMIEDGKKQGCKGPYVFDGFKCEKTEDIIALFKKIGPPDAFV